MTKVRDTLQEFVDFSFDAVKRKEGYAAAIMELIKLKHKARAELELPDDLLLKIDNITTDNDVRMMVQGELEKQAPKYWRIRLKKKD